MVIVSNTPLDLSGLIAILGKEGAGSCVFHLGVVKPVAGGRKSQGIEFKVQGDMTGELKAIEADLRSRYPLQDVILARRVGTLAVGDSILLAAVAAADRDSAFAACREAIERFKTMKTVGKKELYLEP